MRRILIFANTYYQLITAIQMRYTLFSDDYVALLLSDHSRNTLEISRRLIDCKVFSHVNWIATLDKLRGGRLSSYREFFRVVCLGKTGYLYELDGINDTHFDEMVCFNLTEDVYGLYWHLAKTNPNIAFSRYEEGILSYPFIDKGFLSQKRAYVTRLFGRKEPAYASRFLYCFYPNVYAGELEPIQIPRIKRGSECANILQQIFGLDSSKLDYHEKYIFFTSVYDFEGGKPIGEYEVACQVADLVGKDNLLIKVHPRDIRTIYADNGFHVDKNSAVPWEAIQLTGDFSDKVFLTATSGSVLAGSLLSDKPVPTCYLYKLCDFADNPAAAKTRDSIEALLGNELMRDALRFVKAVDNLRDILA